MSENWVRLHVNSATDEWTGWLWCCSRSHAFCPCIYSFMCEVIGSEIVRNTGITRRSGAVGWDGCKTSPLVLKSHKHAQRWRDGSLKAPVFHLPCARVLRCEWTCMHVLAKNRCEFMCAHAHTHKAVQSGLKVHTSYWAVLQSAGLMKRYHILQ